MHEDFFALSEKINKIETKRKNRIKIYRLMVRVSGNSGSKKKNNNKKEHK